MRLTRIALTALLGIVLVSTIACGTKSYQLYTSVSGQGSITPNSGTFLEGDVITLLAMPGSGWEFDHWEGDFSGSGGLITTTMDENKTIVAYFKQVEATPPSGFENYTDYINGFFILFPDSWYTDTGAYYSDSYYWDVFDAPSPCAGQFITFSVTTMDTDYTSAQTYYSEVIKPGIEDLDSYYLISEEDLTINGIPAIKVIYTYDNAYGHTIQIMQCFLIKQQALWWFMVDCAPTCWDTYKDTFNTMVSSFRVLD